MNTETDLAIAGCLGERVVQPACDGEAHDDDDNDQATTAVQPISASYRRPRPSPWRRRRAPAGHAAHPGDSERHQIVERTSAPTDPPQRAADSPASRDTHR